MSWESASFSEQSFVEQTELLSEAPVEGFVPQINVAVAVALLVDSNEQRHCSASAKHATYSPLRRQRSLHENPKPASTHQEKSFKNLEPFAEQLLCWKCGATA